MKWSLHQHVAGQVRDLSFGSPLGHINPINWDSGDAKGWKSLEARTAVARRTGGGGALSNEAARAAGTLWSTYERGLGSVFTWCSVRLESQFHLDVDSFFAVFHCVDGVSLLAVSKQSDF